MMINIPRRRPKPYPNNMCRPTSKYPEVYNKYGEQMEFYFLYDQLMECYSLSRYFLWDRANYGLDTHFYMHNNMLTTKGKPIRKYGLLVESKAIVPDNYRIFDRYRGLEKEFVSIFTYDEDLLNRIENDISDYFFTERIINCFAAQTIPIYLGARKIQEFFNIDGIICVTEKDLEDVEKILRMCTREYYEEHLEAIKDNYRRAYKYQNVWDTLYLEHLKN